MWEVVRLRESVQVGKRLLDFVVMRAINTDTTQVEPDTLLARGL